MKKESDDMFTTRQVTIVVDTQGDSHDESQWQREHKVRLQERQKIKRREE